MQAIVYLKKRSNYTNKVVASCFIKTAAFSEILGERGEIHVYKARLLTVDEFNADVDMIFSDRMIGKLGEIPRVKLIKQSSPVAKTPAPGLSDNAPEVAPEVAKSVETAGPTATTSRPPSARSAAMAAAAEAAENQKPKTK
jgi:hypothetical protein